MNDELTRISARRVALVTEAQAQRRALALNLEPWGRPLTLVDQGLSALRLASQHPAWLMAASILPRVGHAGRVGTWFRRGLVAWQVLAHRRNPQRRLAELKKP